MSTTILNGDASGDNPKSVKEKYNYPEPPRTRENLFFIQRSPNANLVQYEINFTDEGRINSNDPIDVFWLRYNSHGGRRELKWYEKKLAYGVNSRQIDASTFEMNIVSYKKRTIYIVQNDDGSVQANMEINGKISKFESVFIDIKENTFFPSINAIEIFGKDLQTGEEVYERFVP